MISKSLSFLFKQLLQVFLGSKEWFLNSGHQNYLKNLLNNSTTLRVSEPVILGWGPGISISNNFPGDTNATGLRNTP